MNAARRARFLGLPLDPIAMDETLRRIEARIGDGGPGCHLGLNAANVVAARRDPTYAADLHAADIVGPDGQSVVWAARMLGVRVPERVTGIDLMERLVERSIERGWGIYLVGARRPVVEEAGRRFAARGARVVGARDGYFGPDEDAAVAAAVVASGAELLFVGMPSPRKERFMIGAARAAGVPFAVGVGGSFDVVAGRVRRAPRFAQRLGLEWVYRLAQEPRRLLPRYTRTNVEYLVIVARALLRRRRR